MFSLSRFKILILTVLFIGAVGSTNSFAYMKGVTTLGGSASVATPCYLCIGTGTFLWECNSTTVGDNAYSPCGCTDGLDDEGTANDDATITSGECVYDDSGSDGSDYYSFDVFSEDLVDDDLGTVFIRFTITTWADGVRLWHTNSSTQSTTDRIMIPMKGTSSSDIEFKLHYEGDNVETTATTTDANCGQGTEYIIRARWRTSDNDPNVQINVYNTSMVEQGSGASNNTNPTDLDPDPDDFYVGNYGVTTGSNFKINYIHIYNDWLDTDPNA